MDGAIIIVGGGTEANFMFVASEGGGMSAINGIPGGGGCKCIPGREGCGCSIGGGGGWCIIAEYESDVKHMRTNGLTSGCDAAGWLYEGCLIIKGCWKMVILVYRPWYKHKNRLSVKAALIW